METLVTHNLHFLRGEGEMAVLTRKFDWSGTPLGTPESWPANLKMTLSLLLNSKFPMFLWWGDGLIQFYNDAYRPSLGSNGKHPSALGQQARQCWPEIWDVIYPLISHVLKTGEATWSEDQLIPIYRNGSVEDVYWTFGYSAVFGESGVDGVLVVCTETTEKIRLLQALKDSERNFRTMADNIPNLAWMADAQGWIFWYNHKWYEYTGTSPDQMKGWGWQSVHDPAELPQVMENWKGSIESGKPFEMVFPLRGADGKFRQFLTRVLPVRDQDGNIEKWFGTNTDITLQTRAEGAAKESEMRFMTMAESTDVLIATSDETSNATYFNRAWTDFTGRSVKELSQFGWADLIHPEDRQGFLDLYLRAFEKRESWTGEFRMMDKNGEYRWLVARGPVRYGPDGTFAGYISSSIDITELKEAEKIKSENDRNLRNIFAQAPVAMSLFRGDTFIVEIANAKTLENWGKTAEEAIGKPIFEVLPETAGKGFEEILARVLATGESYSARAAAVPRMQNGVLETVYVNFAYEPFREADGTISGVMSVSNDVTAEVLARKKLEASEAKLRAIIDAAPPAIALFVGRDLIVEMPNRAFIEVLGKGVELEGKPLREVMPELESENQPFLQILDDVYTSGKMFQSFASQVNIVRNGVMTNNYYNITYSPLFDAEGKVFAILDIAIDVTEEVKAKNKIIKSEENLRNTILQAPVAMAILRGSEHVVEIANARMYELWGKPAEQMLGRPIFTGLPEVKNQGFEDLLGDVYRTGVGYSTPGVPVTVPREHGLETIYINMLYEPYREGDGTVSGILVVASDISAQVAAQQKIEEEVARRTSQLAEANASLQRSNAELEQFAYIASHDLQEPLRKITTYSHMMKSGAAQPDEKSGKYLDKIIASTTRMHTLIKDVLTYSEVSKISEEHKPVDLNEVMTGIQIDFELLLEQKKAIISGDRLPVVHAIPLQMAQLFSNLVSNALKFSRKDVPPQIHITSGELSPQELSAIPALDQGRRYYKIQVTDNGIGFKEENSAQIFHIFQRLHRKTEYEGTGIGLAMCKKIVENHHGDLNAVGSSEKGAVFNIILPVKET